MVLLYAFNHPYPYQCQDLSAPPIWPLLSPTDNINFTQSLPKYTNSIYNNTNKCARNIHATACCVDLHFKSNSIPPKIIIDFTLDRYKVFRRRICTEPGSEQVGLVLVLGAEVVQSGPIQMFGPKQNYSSKHLDRTSTGPGSEQLRCLNSLLFLL